MEDFAKTFKFFFKVYPGSTFTVVGLLILAGMAEAVGVAAFLPFLQIVLEGGGSSDLPGGQFGGFFSSIGLPLNFGTISIFIACAIGLKAIILWTALRKVSRTVAMIAEDLRWRLMRALLQANWRYFTDQTLGSSLNAVVMESFRSSMAFVSATRFFSHLMQFLVYAGGALLLSVPVFLGGIVVGSVLVVVLWTLVRMARNAGIRQTETAKDMLSHMADMLQGIKPLRAMALEQKFLDVLRSHSSQLEKAQVDQLFAAQAMRIFHEPLMVTTVIAGLFIVTATGILSNSELALMAILFMRLLTGMNSAQNEYQRMVNQEAALWSLIGSIEETEAASDHWPGSGGVPDKIEHVAFRDVCFSHGEKVILRNANLDIEAKSLTALVGMSGSGKTTILDLLSGFYLPESGIITVNGKNLSDIDLNEWRRNIGFVPQEVFLFNDSILENILMGRKDLSEDDAWEAIQAAEGLDFVSALPNGIHSPVGENGRLLSGGQRQRIAIARAIVHRPQLLLLDEATSALDPETEGVLLETLKRLSENMAVIFVSHNTAVLGYAQKIYKIKDGLVSEGKSK